MKIGIRLRFFLAIVGLMSLAGCRTATKYAADTKFKVEKTTVDLSALAPGRIPVEIRWPAAVAPEVLELLAEHATDQTIKADGTNFKNYCDKAICNLANLVKTAELNTYYVMELFALIKHDNPDLQVVLTPMIITVDRNSREPRIFPAQPAKVASSVVINFFEVPDTFDRPSVHSWPNMNVKVASRYQPASCGYISSMRMGRHVGGGKAGCVNSPARDEGAFDMIKFFTGDVALEQPWFETTKTPAIGSGVSVLFPEWYVFFKDPYVSDSTKPGFVANGSTIFLPHIRDYARLSLQVFGSIRWATFGSAEDLDIIKFYDPGLHSRLESVKPLSEKDDRNVQLIAKLADAEIKWAAAKSDFIADEVLNGPFGRSFRAERRAALNAQSKYNRAMLGSIVSTIAAGAQSGLFSKPGTGMYRPDLLMSSVRDVNELTDATISKINEDLISSFAKEGAMRTQRANVLLGEKAEEIYAKDLAGLHASLKGLYGRYAHR